jgi:hypothetical protein
MKFGGETFVVNPPHTPQLDKMAESDNSILFHERSARHTQRNRGTLEQI